MGCYVNPRHQTKEEWLAQNAYTTLEPGRKPAWEEAERDDCLPVCLVDNGPFTAAGIAYCKWEMDAFLRPDGREKRWFYVPTSRLLEVAPDLRSYLDYISTKETT